MTRAHPPTRPRDRLGPPPAAWFCLALAVWTAACASLPENERPFPGAEPRATIVVDNFESGYVGMVVSISSTTGGTYRLGSVSTAGSSRFEFRDVRSGEYVLEGRRAGQRPLRSPPFLLGDGDTIEWNLGDNRISYR